MNYRKPANVRTENSHARYTQRILSFLLAIATTIFLPALLLPAPAMAQTAGVLCTQTGDEYGYLDEDLHYFLGESVQIYSSGFAPACDLDIEIDRPDGSVDTATVTTDADGNFSFSYSQTGLIGDYVARMKGRDNAELLNVLFTAGPLISLDKGDYRSGETVSVTGLSFFPYEDIAIRITRPDGSVVKSDGTPGSDTVATDATGDLAYDYVLRDGVEAKYSVDALDQEGAVVASAAFTDSYTYLGTYGTAIVSPGAGNTSITISNNCLGSACGLPAVTTAPANSSIIVAVSAATNVTFCTGPGGACCTDSAGHIYNTDVKIEGSEGLLICSTHNITTSFSGTITAYHNIGTNRASTASASVFTGLDGSNPLDATGKNVVGSNSASLTTNATTTGTQQDNELLFATFGFGTTCGGVCPTFVPGVFNPGGLTATCTQNPCTVFQGIAANQRRLGSEYGKGVWGSLTNPAFTGTGSISGTQRPYTAAIATYKIAANPTVTLTKTWVSAVPNDTTTLTISGTQVSNAVGGSSTAPSTTTNATANAVVGSTVNLAETLGGTNAGSYTSALACSTASGSVTVTSGSITMPNAAVTCTFTNTGATNSVTLTKSWVNAVASDTTTLTISGTQVSGASGGTSTAPSTTTDATATAVVGSTVNLAETLGVGNTGTYTPGLACSTSGGSVTVTSGSITMPNAAVTCTFTNTGQSATLTVIKKVINDNGGSKTSANFSITVTGTNVAPSATFNGADTPGTTVTLDPGSYSVDEAADSGYTKTLGTDCSGSIAAGQSKTCTITNDDKPGTLIVIKKVTNDNGGTKTAADFSMSVTGTNVLPSATFPGADTPGTTVTLNAGSYSVDETADSGYTKSSSADCSGSIANGETKTCTITNDDKPGSLTVIKKVINDSGGSKTSANFSITVTGTNVAPSATFNGADTPGTTVTLNAGSYSVDEAADSGYTKNLGADCSGSIANGESKTCTITNDDKPGSLTVIKHVINDSGGAKTASDFSMSVTGTNVQPSATFPGAESPGTTVTLNAGSYSVNETADPAYTKTIGAYCSGSIANGESKTCTITNDDKPGTLVVTKHVINDNGGGATAANFTMSVTGTNVQPSASFAGAESPGTTVTLNAGAYGVDEAAFFGYAKSIGANCSGSIANGETKYCTITNNDIQPTITVNKVLSPSGDPGRFNLRVNSVVKATNVGNGGTTGAVGINAGTYPVDETGGTVPPTSLANYTSGIDCGAFGSASGTSINITLSVGDSAVCTITNTVKDSDGDGIPDFLDCQPTLYDNRVVDPSNVLAAYPVLHSYATLQLAVNAAIDDDVITMYGNTTENVIIGSTTGSGGKDLRIIGCGHKITSANPINTNPVIKVEASAGKAGDSNAPGAEMDMQIEDLNVLKGSQGFVVNTTTAAAGGHVVSTLLKSIRSDTNKYWGIQITGDGNEVRGANSVGTNGTALTDGGIKVNGDDNLLRSNRVASNKGNGIDVTGNSNELDGNSIGDKGVGNTGKGINIAGNTSDVHDNNVLANGLTGIYVVGDNNQVYKNDVGDKGTGNNANAAAPKDSKPGGIYVQGNTNVVGKDLNDNDVFGNTGHGMQIVGNGNTIAKNSVGDDGKGNTGDGINVAGSGNTIDENDVFENSGDGIDVSGGTTGSPNVISNNNVGDRGKGNLGDGILVSADTGNGTMNPVEIIGNTVRSNKLYGIEVRTSYGHQLANNVSGGTGSYASGGQDNGKCEFLVAADVPNAKYNFNAGGNTANGAVIAGAMNSNFPSTCQGTGP